MSKRKIMVTLFKGGTDEKIIPIEQVVIPDLWDIAQAVRKGTYMDPARRKKVCGKILEIWHTAAWLKKHIQENEGKAEERLKIKLVFSDWKTIGVSIYSTRKGNELSKGSFHSGTTFDGTITLDREDERELRKSILKGYQPCFWISAFGDEIKPKEKKKAKKDIIRCYHHHTSNEHPACFNTRKENRGPGGRICEHGHHRKDHPACFRQD